MKRILFCILIFGSGVACAMEQEQAIQVGKDILDCWLERDKSCDQGLVKLESRIAKIKGKRTELWKLIGFVLNTESAFREFNSWAHAEKLVSPTVLQELDLFRKPVYGADRTGFGSQEDVANQIKMRGRWRWAKKLAFQMRAQPQDPYAQDNDELLRALLEMFSGTMREIHDILRVGSGVKLDDFRTRRGQDFYNWARDMRECGLLAPASFVVLTQPLSHAPFDAEALCQADHIRVHDYFKRKELEEIAHDNQEDEEKPGRKRKRKRDREREPLRQFEADLGLAAQELNSQKQ